MKRSYTEQAADALRSAHLEAARQGDSYLGTSRLMLALLAPAKSTAREALERLSIDVAKVTADLESGDERLPVMPSVGVALSPRAKEALQHADAIAGEFLEPLVDTVHLMLGILFVKDGVVASAFAAQGVGFAEARAAAEAAQKARPLDPLQQSLSGHLIAMRLVRRPADQIAYMLLLERDPEIVRVLEAAGIDLTDFQCRLEKDLGDATQRTRLLHDPPSVAELFQLVRVRGVSLDIESPAIFYLVLIERGGSFTARYFSRLGITATSLIEAMTVR